ncbi:hypothetical protein SAMN05444401_1443 [Clostridium amylolyticum]|uniref:Uncharacterized protein n=1 Tax=Clostridium amylolyticum TaxID=1121298 RepID=A0A1M6DF49_9CLOT|nr:NAD(P)/FAD-dependent oxidoreductase [Clostridium amylolyticum]SHI71701.1 hypothetical protein SAMN05444401_1443 [Clostridium amylolyticum]
MAKVIVIGGGPAGMMAAIKASENHSVILVEGNERLGKKLFITGKGRCNVTNAKDISELFEYIPGNPSFLYSALYTFTNEDVINMFNSLGVELKIERGDRVFPKSDKSSDITNALQKKLISSGVEILLKSKVDKLIKKENKITGVMLSSGENIKGDYFIMATGGKSYPSTGSTGDGYKFAKDLGHTIIEPKPSLVPIEISDEWVKKLQGLSLKNIEVKLYRDNKLVFKDFGEMLFTHFGISGPVILSASRYISGKGKYILSINLKPALNEQELDMRIQKDFKKYINKDFKNSLDDLLPQKLIDTIIYLSNIDANKKVNTITKEERKNLLYILQNLNLNVRGLRPIEEAIVTAGGVSTKEIDSSTMKSKLVNNLSFCGEIIDVDAFTGGYNVQIALSTGYLAGEKVGEI